MTGEETEEPVGLPPTFKNTLKSILAHAASQDRTVIEFRTTETASGRRHFTSALDITEHVGELEKQMQEEMNRE